VKRIVVFYSIQQSRGDMIGEHLPDSLTFDKRFEMTAQDIAKRALESPADAPVPADDLDFAISVTEELFELLRTRKSPEEIAPIFAYTRRLPTLAAARLYAAMLMPEHRKEATPVMLFAMLKEKELSDLVGSLIYGKHAEDPKVQAFLEQTLGLPEGAIAGQRKTAPESLWRRFNIHHPQLEKEIHEHLHRVQLAAARESAQPQRQVAYSR